MCSHTALQLRNVMRRCAVHKVQQCNGLYGNVYRITTALWQMFFNFRKASCADY